MEKQKDEQTGSMLYSPSMPGQKLGQALPYFFDEVLVLRAEKDADGNLARFFQTAGDYNFTAKDRSGALDLYEPADFVRHSRQDRWHHPAVTTYPPTRSNTMAFISFNATQVQPQASFDPIPAGKYICQIVESEIKSTKAGTYQQLALTWEVLDGIQGP